MMPSALKHDARCSVRIIKAGRRSAAVSFHSTNCGLKQITDLALTRSMALLFLCSVLDDDH
jgi:predicted RNA-binding Zn-ribbon protein involved in translation (DUF1610 family)